MNKNLGLLFYVKRSKMLANGTAPVYLRITVDGDRADISSKRYIDPKKWNATGQKLGGSGEEVKSFNVHLKMMEHQAYEAYSYMIDRKLPLTAAGLKKLMSAKDEPLKGRMLMPIFEEHNNQVRALVGREFAPGTYERYETSLRHTKAFLQWKYQVDDIDIRGINHEFVTSYDFYLRSERHCNNNSTVKYLKNFKKIILICIANGWLDKDPFVKYKPKVKEVIRQFLTSEELEIITHKKLLSSRLAQVRDIFLFSCYTGLAYADVKKLKRSEVVPGINGQKWILTSRQKTDTASRIPLLPQAVELMNRYEDDPQCEAGDVLLPVLSNQKMNSYLKEIADFCGIKKDLTYHIARHTFATTVTLANGVSIESVSKMLGHTNIRTTQHYAKILDTKVGADMQMLQEKLFAAEQKKKSKKLIIK